MYTCPFINSYDIKLPMYADKERSFYHSLGLGRTCKPYNIKNFYYFAVKFNSGTKRPKLIDGDDLFNMAGDYIFSNEGKLVYQFSMMTLERPSVDELLHAVPPLK